jgi:hypothetical protein
MRLAKICGVAALAIAAAACNQGNSDNVMSPQANALEPADVNAALGPEVTNTSEANMTGSDVNGVNSVDNRTNINDVPDEPGTPVSNNNAG